MQQYNHERLHSAIGFITPADMLAGQAEEIWAARDRKLEAARARRLAAEVLESARRGGDTAPFAGLSPTAFPP